MAEEITNNTDISFKDIHPTQTAGGKLQGRDLPDWAGLDGLESDYVRCKQCGFPNKLSRTHRGSGWGNITTEYTTDSIGYNDSDTWYNREINYDGKIWIDTEMAGCAFCHTSEYI